MPEVTTPLACSIILRCPHPRRALRVSIIVRFPVSHQSLRRRRPRANRVTSRVHVQDKNFYSQLSHRVSASNRRVEESHRRSRSRAHFYTIVEGALRRELSRRALVRWRRRSRLDVGDALRRENLPLGRKTIFFAGFVKHEIRDIGLTRRT